MTPRLEDEIWFAIKLKQAGATIFDGLTTPEQRAERARQAILAHGLADEVIGRRGGEPWSFAQAFEALYGCPLEEIA